MDEESIRRMTSTMFTTKLLEFLDTLQSLRPQRTIPIMIQAVRATEAARPGKTLEAFAKQIAPYAERTASDLDGFITEDSSNIKYLQRIDCKGIWEDLNEEERDRVRVSLGAVLMHVHVINNLGALTNPNHFEGNVNIDLDAILKSGMFDGSDLSSGAQQCIRDLFSVIQREMQSGSDMMTAFNKAMVHMQEMDLDDVDVDDLIRTMQKNPQLKEMFQQIVGVSMDAIEKNPFQQ